MQQERRIRSGRRRQFLRQDSTLAASSSFKEAQYCLHENFLSRNALMAGNFYDMFYGMANAAGSQARSQFNSQLESTLRNTSFPDFPTNGWTQQNNVGGPQTTQNYKMAPPASKKAIKNLAIVPVTADDLIEESNKECLICLCEQKIGSTACKLACGHLYHQACLTEWLEKSCTCKQLARPSGSC